LLSRIATKKKKGLKHDLCGALEMTKKSGKCIVKSKLNLPGGKEWLKSNNFNFRH
jgi:hypothetical protein